MEVNGSRKECNGYKIHVTRPIQAVWPGVTMTFSDIVLDLGTRLLQVAKQNVPFVLSNHLKHSARGGLPCHSCNNTTCEATGVWHSMVCHDGGYELLIYQ